MSGPSPASAASVPPALAVLTVAEMYAADNAAAAMGIPSLTLMEHAGAAVVHAITARWPRQPVTVLCGPGNNGGDGYVIARLLRDAGWPVRLAGVAVKSQTDAAVNAERWRAVGGATIPLTVAAVDGTGLVIDAVFGAGLTRPLAADVRAIIARITATQMPCIAVDVPSGVAGDTGEVLGDSADGAPQCAATVTFFRPKPTHFLYPGRALCGDVIVADIGIPADVLRTIQPRTCANAPQLWHVPSPQWSDHKYTRGHAVVVGSGHMTGAPRLAARGARRAGAGLLTLSVPAEAVSTYAASEVGAMVEARPGSDLTAALADRRRNCVLIGPGCGVGAETRAMVLACLASSKSVVLDADALTSFESAPQELFAAIGGRTAPTVMTPHGGEFARLFGGSAPGGKVVRTRAAAAASHATVVFKGPDSVVAAPDGRAAIASNAPPWLATGGSGDVLAGVILGLLALGCDGWTAATAGVWLHGAAGTSLGRGLLAEEIPEALPRVLAALAAKT